MLSLPTRRLLFCLLLCLCIMLQSCATAKTSQQKMKTGLYIDALLEFVVEYPLSWSKDRRIAYGKKAGEVRWTPPDHPQTFLRIKSYLPNQQVLSIEQRINDALHEYVGLEVLTKKTVSLPAGEAWHITGQTAQGDAEIYLLLSAERSYSIDLMAPADSIDSFKDVMERVTLSFQSIHKKNPR